jgi:TRAP-type C4-dicarboxylate transport system permease small subunit
LKVKIEKYIEKLSDSLFFVAGLSIILMVFMTTLDVVMRFFRVPIKGVYDIVTILSAIGISFAIARTTLQKGHIAVNLVTRLLPQKIQNIIAVITNIISFTFLFFLARELWKYGAHLSIIGEVSLTIQIPFYYIIYSISVSIFLVCIIELYDTAKNIIELGKR